MNTLVLGGARSGKSRYAQRLAQDGAQTVVYIATATAGDEEMAARIAHHQKTRPGSWQLVEQPRHLTKTLVEYADPKRLIIVDCLTLWASNIMFGLPGQPADSGFSDFETASASLRAVLPDLAGDTVLVSNEVGQGVVPIGAETRRYVDEMGLLHQQLATLCDRVVLVTAGLPQIIKG